MITPMKGEDIRAFAGRDWAAIAEAKAAFWAGRKRSMTAAEALATAEMLRQHALLVKPGWRSTSGSRRRSAPSRQSAAADRPAAIARSGLLPAFERELARRQEDTR